MDGDGDCGLRTRRVRDASLFCTPTRLHACHGMIQVVLVHLWECSCMPSLAERLCDRVRFYFEFFPFYGPSASVATAGAAADPTGRQSWQSGPDATRRGERESRPDRQPPARERRAPRRRLPESGGRSVRRRGRDTLDHMRSTVDDRGHTNGRAFVVSRQTPALALPFASGRGAVSSCTHVRHACSHTVESYTRRGAYGFSVLASVKAGLFGIW